MHAQDGGGEGGGGMEGVRQENGGATWGEGRQIKSHHSSLSETTFDTPPL